jgi:hypothetical protein
MGYYGSRISMQSSQHLVDPPRFELRQTFSAIRFTNGPFVDSVRRDYLPDFDFAGFGSTNNQ